MESAPTQSAPALTVTHQSSILPAMGFLTRLFVPRGIRRVMRPVRAVKRAATPKAIKRARRAAHPLDNAAYALTRSLNTKRRPKAPAFRHGSCPIKHRTASAAMKCRNR